MSVVESEGNQGYPATHWSQIYLAGQPELDAGTQALDALLRVYSPPLLAHLQQRFRVSEADSRDWLHGFIEKKVLRNRLLEQADGRKGRFRSFLLTALDNYVLDEIRRREGPTRKPVGGTVSLEQAIGMENISAEDGASHGNSFDVAWGRTVLELAAERTRGFYERKGARATWGVFEQGFLLPMQTGEKRPSDSELARRHGFDSARQASNAIITAKREFGKQLRRVIAEYAKTATEVDEEIRDLMHILSETES